jgi:PLP dependent protein
MMSMLADNLAYLEEAIAAACRHAGRARGEIELMAVSKTFPASAVAEAAHLGIVLFGENRVQEFAAKASELTTLGVPQVRLFGPGSASNSPCPIHGPGRPILSQSAPADIERRRPQIRVHLIGHLQSNKTARAAELFDGIDSVDSIKLAERLNSAAGKLGKRLPILIELKLSPEETKSGIDPESGESSALLERLPGLTHLELQGLMTIAPWGVAEDVTRACFRSMRAWRDRWAAAHSRLSFDVLSMGMSGDFALAIEEGSTRIRIGTALFGKRAPQPETGYRNS